MMEALKNSNMFSSFGSVAGIGAALVLLGSSWRHIVNFFVMIRNMLLSRSVYKKEASAAVLGYILSKGKVFKFGMRAYSGSKHFVNPIKRVEAIAYEDITNEPMLVWLEGRLLVLRRSGKDSKVETAGDNGYSDDPENPIELTVFRGLIDLDALVTRALKLYNQTHQANNKDDPSQRRFSVRRLGRSTKDEERRGRAMAGNSAHTDGIEKSIRSNNLRLLNWNVKDIGQIKTDNSAFNVFFYPAQVMRVVEEIRCWLKYEDWFKDKGIPWRMGCLFHGKPGTGKSTLIRSIAMEMDMPVFILDLTSMDNVSLNEAWEEVQQNAPAIALIEDIDSVFNGRTNVSATNVMRDSLTYDCLLNTISGVKNSDGVLLCVTTNDISKLDPALGIPNSTGDSTRPGRIDRGIELVDMQTPERRKVAEYILKDCSVDIEAVINAGKDETAAQFQSRCTGIALAEFWKNNILK